MTTWTAGPCSAFPDARVYSSLRLPGMAGRGGRPLDAGAPPRLGVRSRAVQEDRTPIVEIRRTALIGHSAGSTFDLIEAAERYPEFLPWCAAATILARDDTVVAARLSVDYRGLRFGLTTRNPKQRPHYMAIRLEEGPFRHFEGEWRLVELGSNACKIEFTLRYEFDSALVGKLADGVFARIADTMIDAFANRAEAVLGPVCGHDDPPTSPEPGDPS